MNKNRQRGKDFEKFLATDLGGRRVGILGKEDVDLPFVSAECKERKRLPKFITDCLSQAIFSCLDDKFPVVFLHELSKDHNSDVVLMRYADFKAIYLLYKKSKEERI